MQPAQVRIISQPQVATPVQVQPPGTTALLPPGQAAQQKKGLSLTVSHAVKLLACGRFLYNSAYFHLARVSENSGSFFSAVLWTIKCGLPYSLNTVNQYIVYRFFYFQREQMVEAQEMFRTSNKVTRPEKALILGFMAGSRGRLTVKMRQLKISVLLYFRCGGLL